MIRALILIGSLSWLAGCASLYNPGGSPPANAAEMQNYKAEVMRCFRTGGTRVIKVQDYIRCY